VFLAGGLEIQKPALAAQFKIMRFAEEGVQHLGPEGGFLPQSTSGLVTEVQWTVPRSVYGGTGFFTDEQDLKPKPETGISELCGEMQQKLGSFKEEIGRTLIRLSELTRTHRFLTAGISSNPIPL
jgi:hypothetical protein